MWCLLRLTADSYSLLPTPGCLLVATCREDILIQCKHVQWPGPPFKSKKFVFVCGGGEGPATPRDSREAYYRGYV